MTDSWGKLEIPHIYGNFRDRTDDFRIQHVSIGRYDLRGQGDVMWDRGSFANLGLLQTSLPARHDEGPVYTVLVQKFGFLFGVNPTKQKPKLLTWYCMMT